MQRPGRSIPEEPVDVAGIARALFADGPAFARFLQHHRHRIAPVGRLVELVPHGSDVLDVGCGGGLFLMCLAASGRAELVYGVDASANAIAAADAAAWRLRKQGSQANIVFEHRTVQQGLPEIDFGVVSMIDVMHHVPVEAQERAFHDAASRVRPGGMFIYKDMCDGPLWRAGMNRLHDLIMARQWIRYVPIERVDEWAAEAGLVAERVEEHRMLWYGHELRVYRRPEGSAASAALGAVA